MSNTKINEQHAKMYFPKNILEGINLFRNIALEVDQNPSAILDCIDGPIFKNLCEDQDSNCLQRTQLIEALSYGDAGVTLAAPGPSLAGLILRELGDSDQKQRFFSYLKQHRCSTFLAVTEPGRGSDAAQMETTLKSKGNAGFVLNGEKCFIGHGADAPIGIVMARRSAGPLGVCSVLLTSEELNRPEVERIPLDMLGLRGACLARIIFNELEIKNENILGLHLSPMKSGMMAMMKTFNRMRPAVAAFALGHAQAVLDYAKENLNDFQEREAIPISKMDAEISLIRSLLYACAARVDEDPSDNSFASIAKVKATHLAEKVTIEVIKGFGVNAVQRHPLLMKWYRDVFGFEFMEGTTTMQLRNIYQGYRNSTKENRNA